MSLCLYVDFEFVCGALAPCRAPFGGQPAGSAEPGIPSAARPAAAMAACRVSALCRSPLACPALYFRLPHSRRSQVLHSVRDTSSLKGCGVAYSIYNTIGGLRGTAALNPGRPPIVDQPVVSEPNPRGQVWCAMVCVMRLIKGVR